jgi:hypothetical protein
MVSEATTATLAGASVTASFPFYLYGAWIVIDSETVTWSVLLRHLKFIVGWMAPRLMDQFGGLAVLHAVLGLQAYAMLAFALTGIVRIFQAKRAANLYHDPDQDVDLNDLHENMSAWRGRLRIGVFGYVLFWIGAYLIGVVRYVQLHL